MTIKDVEERTGLLYWSSLFATLCSINTYL